MTPEQARTVLPGTRVMWDGNPDDLGTVRELGRTGFLVKWARAPNCWIPYDDDLVSLVDSTPATAGRG